MWANISLVLPVVLPEQKLQLKSKQPINHKCPQIEHLSLKGFALVERLVKTTPKGAFTGSVFQAVFVSGTFDLFLNGLNRRLKNAACKHIFKLCLHIAFFGLFCQQHLHLFDIV